MVVRYLILLCLCAAVLLGETSRHFRFTFGKRRRGRRGRYKFTRGRIRHTPLFSLTYPYRNRGGTHSSGSKSQSWREAIAPYVKRGKFIYGVAKKAQGVYTGATSAWNQLRLQYAWASSILPLWYSFVRGHV